METPDLAALLTEQILSKTRNRIPVSSPRIHASWLGTPCRRWCYYKRTAGELETQVTDSLQLVFREGNLVEADIYGLLTSRPFGDIEVVATQVGEPLPGNISGACDAIIRIKRDNEWCGPYVLEIKSVSPNIYGRINSVEDFNRHSWSMRYVPQVHIYNRMAEVWLSRNQRVPGTIQGAIFLLKCKSAGALKQLYVPRDVTAEDDLIKKAIDIEGCVAARMPPERIPWCSLCSECSFLHVCLPPQAYEQIPTIADPEVVSACSEIIELAPTLADIRTRYEAARNLVRSRIELIGDACEDCIFIGDPPQYEARLSRTEHKKRLIVEEISNGARHNSAEEEDDSAAPV